MGGYYQNLPRFDPSNPLLDLSIPSLDPEERRRRQLENPGYPYPPTDALPSVPGISEGPPSIDSPTDLAGRPQIESALEPVAPQREVPKLYSEPEPAREPYTPPEHEPYDYSAMTRMAAGEGQVPELERGGILRGVLAGLASTNKITAPLAPKALYKNYDPYMKALQGQKMLTQEAEAEDALSTLRQKDALSEYYGALGYGQANGSGRSTAQTGFDPDKFLAFTKAGFGIPGDPTNEVEVAPGLRMAQKPLQYITAEGLRGVGLNIPEDFPDIPIPYGSSSVGLFSSLINQLGPLGPKDEVSLEWNKDTGQLIAKIVQDGVPSAKLIDIPGLEPNPPGASGGSQSTLEYTQRVAALIDKQRTQGNLSPNEEAELRQAQIVLADLKQSPDSGNAAMIYNFMAARETDPAQKQRFLDLAERATRGVEDAFNVGGQRPTVGQDPRQQFDLTPPTPSSTTTPESTGIPTPPGIPMPGSSSGMVLMRTPDKSRVIQMTREQAIQTLVTAGMDPQVAEDMVNASLAKQQ